MSLSKKLRKHRPKAWKARPEVLLDPPIPIPLSGTAPRVLLGDKWWDKERRAAKLKTGFHCIVCRDGGYLDCHERYEIDWLLGRATYIETVPLCFSCHSFIHQGYLKVSLEAGKITRQEMEDLLERGRDILRGAGLKRPDDSIHKGWASVEWSDWRMVIAGEEYPPLYESLDDYKRNHRG